MKKLIFISILLVGCAEEKEEAPRDLKKEKLQREIDSLDHRIDSLKQAKELIKVKYHE